jgi:hypothetical protein
MTLKLGTSATIAGHRCEVVSIRDNGTFVMRKIKGGRKSDGTQYAMGEAVRIIQGDRLIPGEITSLSPLQATVTEGAAKGWVVGSSRIRKAKERT